MWRRKTCTLLRAKMSALLRSRTCAVLRARTCALFRANTKETTGWRAAGSPTPFVVASGISRHTDVCGRSCGGAPRHIKGLYNRWRVCRRPGHRTLDGARCCGPRPKAAVAHVTPDSGCAAHTNVCTAVPGACASLQLLTDGISRCCAHAAASQHFVVWHLFTQPTTTAAWLGERARGNRHWCGQVGGKACSNAPPRASQMP